MLLFFKEKGKIEFIEFAGNSSSANFFMIKRYKEVASFYHHELVKKFNVQIIGGPNLDSYGITKNYDSLKGVKLQQLKPYGVEFIISI